MRLNQLKYFIKVVECGSITKAAQELYLSQPSLTKAVSSLEAEYNLKLFDRTAKGLSLTPRGRDFLEYARSVLDSSKALDQTFGRKDHPFIQRVAIARALASEAKVLLADEPTGNLDEATAFEVTAILKRIAHEEDRCVIVVTHSRELAGEADEIIRIGAAG